MVEAGLDALGVVKRLENGVVLLLLLLGGGVLAARRQIGDRLHDLGGLHVSGRELVLTVGLVELLEERLVLVPERHHLLGVEVRRSWRHVEEVGHVVPLEELSLPWVAEHLLGQEVLVDLPLVDLLLDAASQHQPVHGHVSALADAPCPLASLHVGHWIPVRVEDHHPVGPDDVEAYAAHASGQDHGEEVDVGVELLDHLEPSLHWCLAVDAQVRVVHVSHPRLDDLQHLDRLHEDEHTVSLGAPELHDLGQDLHLPRALEAPHVRGLELLVCMEEQKIGVVAQLAKHTDGEEDCAGVLLLP
mmetsp:Transcript_14164/g.40507  ORF Transcript_14164/g.40507 Transcript_14164/m.40507 type:complete len:302 (+) Transcript_14164:1194-2099(+)